MEYQGPAELNDGNWHEVFGYAGGESNVCETSAPMRVEGSKCSTEVFGRKDVAVILASTYGENEESEWEIAGLLFDGRWFYIAAGCDYTGWGCQQSGQAWVADDKDSLIQFGIPAETRDKWNLS